MNIMKEIKHEIEHPSTDTYPDLTNDKDKS